MRKLFIFCAALIIAACAKEIEEVKVYELGCPEPTQEAGPEAGSVTFQIYASSEYSAAIDNDWLSVKEYPGKETFSASSDGVLTVEFTHNPEDTREGTLTLSMPTRTITLKVIQTGDKTPPVTIEVANTAVSSSTLTFVFGEGKTAAEKYTKPYTFGLFRDKECTDTVVYHYVAASSSIWKKTSPAFTFAGLEPETVYYFSVKDTSSVTRVPASDSAAEEIMAVCRESEVLEVSTLPFSVVEAGSVTPAENTVIFAEDFSEIVWNGDEVNAAAGFRSSDISAFLAPSGTKPDGGFGARDYECELLTEGGLAEAVASSRLAHWSVLPQKGASANRQKMIFARPGYVKMGGYSWTADFVTPSLGTMPAGKLANIKVDFTASRYSTSDSENAIVSLVYGTVKDGIFTPAKRIDKQIDVNSAVGWNPYSVTFENVRSDARVLIGPDFDKTGYGLGKVQQRMFLDDIKVTVESLADNGQIIETEAVDVSSSTATFTFGEGEDIAEKRSYEYSVALYSDSSCQNLVIKHKHPANSDCWGDDKTPNFTFAGLVQGTTYYFRVLNHTTGKYSTPVEIRTDDFTVVDPGSVSDASSGDVILAEDFSLLSWGGDQLAGGSGFVGSDISAFRSPSGEYPEGQFVKSDKEYRLFYADELLPAVTSSRLKDWSMLEQPNTARAGQTVFARGGFLKIGGYSWTSDLVTPALSGIPSGKVAKVKVEFDASSYTLESDPESVIVSAVSGTVSDHRLSVSSRDDHQLEIDPAVGWNTYSATFEGVSSDTRILVGPDFEKSGKGNGKSQHRMFLDNIKVTILDLAEDVTPTGVAAKDVYYSDAKVVWNTNQSVESYSIYVNGSRYAEGLSPEVNEYHFTGLNNATEYTVSVAAVVAGEESMSSPVSFTTHGVRIVEEARTHICVEWDDLVTTEVVIPWTSEGSLAEGQDRAYVMELYSDSQCKNPIMTLYPYDGINVARFAFNDGMGNRSGQYWNGVIKGVPRRVATRVSIGCLSPGTDYWFRVRSMETLNVTGPKGDKVMTNPAGTSQWSSPVKLTTASARSSSSGEILYKGFDEFTVQKDMHNQCPGIQPNISTEGDRLKFASAGDKLSYSYGLCSYYGMGHFYKTHNFGWITSLTTKYDNLAYYEYADNSGWRIVGNTAPEMGYLHVDATVGNGIMTPSLSSSLLSGSGTDCTLTFKAFAIHSSLRQGATVTINVSVLRNDEKVETVALSLPYRYVNASPTASDYVPDTEWITLSADLNLKPGDVVLIQNGVAYRWMIDDILIVKK